MTEWLRLCHGDIHLCFAQRRRSDRLSSPCLGSIPQLLLVHRRSTPDLSCGGWLSVHFALWAGLNGRSSVREVELETGRVLRSARLPQRDFGEGITRLGDR